MPFAELLNGAVKFLRPLGFPCAHMRAHACTVLLARQWVQVLLLKESGLEGSVRFEGTTLCISWWPTSSEVKEAKVETDVTRWQIQQENKANLGPADKRWPRRIDHPCEESASVSYMKLSRATVIAQVLCSSHSAQKSFHERSNSCAFHRACLCPVNPPLPT